MMSEIVEFININKLFQFNFMVCCLSCKTLIFFKIRFFFNAFFVFHKIISLKGFENNCLQVLCKAFRALFTGFAL